jgi:asparaginyl-tRNA synthetase
MRLDNCREDLEFLNKMIDNALIERLEFVLANRYDEADLHGGR